MKIAVVAATEMLEHSLSAHDYCAGGQYELFAEQLVLGPLDPARERAERAEALRRQAQHVLDTSASDEVVVSREVLESLIRRRRR